MSAQFTPGPWSVIAYGDGDSLVVHDARGDWRVCFMATPSKDCDFEGIEANACLIAAAPTLLAEVESALIFLRTAPLESGVCCCGDAVDSHNMGSGHSPVDELQYHAANLAERLEAAIAKARSVTKGVVSQSGDRS